MKFKIKVDKYFLQRSKDSCPLYILAASIQDGMSGKLFYPSVNSFSLSFSSNKIRETTQAIVTMNPYNEVELNIHQDMFEDGHTFYLLLEAIPRMKDKHMSPIIFGRSQMIS